MADENTTPEMDVQLSKKITVKLKPLALKKATVGDSPAEESAPAAPEMKKATQVVRTTDCTPAPEAPAAPEMKKATQVVRTTDCTPAPAAPAVPEINMLVLAGVFLIIGACCVGVIKEGKTNS